MSRVCALSLVALILLPFSAPFSTCDLGSLFPGAAHQAAHPLKSRVPVASLGDSATSHALPLPRSIQRLKLVVLPARSVAISVVRPRLSVRSGQHTLVFVGSAFVSPLRI